MTLLRLSNISKQGLGDFKLQEITFEQRKGQKIAIAGETGSGKSTLLKIIAGLEQPDSGEIYFKNESIKQPDKLIAGYPGIAYLTQDFALPKFLRVQQVLQYANNIAPDKAHELFEVCEISHLLMRKTDELSGGERQRIALCRLLITSPQLLLLDEPFSNLDMMHRITLKKVLKKISKQLEITCILVSHEPSDVLPWADKVIVIRYGLIVQKGTPRKIYNKPTDEYTAGLFGPYNLIAAQLAARFHQINKRKLATKDLIIRPEEFRIVKKKKGFFSGIVENISFLGTHYEIEVGVDSTKIIVNSKRKLRKGQLVHLTF
jgi:ABC-type Fe3+/spermidine/putrescine transport system ATPase subunit